MTQYEAIPGKKPNVSNMHLFGSQCFAYIDEKKKLDDRCEEGIFIGSDQGSPAYLVYFPNDDKAKKARCIRFTERIVTEHAECDVTMREV